MTSNQTVRLFAALALCGALTACGDDDGDGPLPMTDGGTDASVDATTPPGDDGGTDAGLDAGTDGGELAVPETYAFDSRFEAGASSVAYSGQAARNVLVANVRTYIDGTGAMLVDPTFMLPDGVTAGERVLEDLEYFFGPLAAERASDRFDARLARFADVGAGLTLRTPGATAADDNTYGALSGSAFLLEKVAGNDASTDHRNWSTAFVGYAPESAALFRGESVDVSTPTGLLRAIFSTTAANADDFVDNIDRFAPGRTEALPVHITSSGIHLGQLAEKFMFGALAFSQAVDDYLDDEEEDAGKGLLAPNTRDGSARYTVLEHQWDEGFGYFGAPRHVSQIPLATLVAGPRGFDANGDMEIDVRSEYLFPTARYAALRDNGSAASARTTYLADIDRAFRTGRAIITNAGESLTAEELDALRAQRDIIVQSWERVLAGSAVSYLNAVIRHTLVIDDTDPATTYNFTSHAAAWSELKGFALAFQFHRRSPMLVSVEGEERFVTLHRLIGDAPVLSDATPAERAQYVTDLLAARAIFAAAYGFDAANLGGDDGVGGW